ncbi:MAG: class I SAM-dependent methyltransferase [Sphingomonadales bacterium]|nr:class I SAM-dependent methyltransferase [Sphingomonadales bacterium]NCO49576.1 class I SAM-dependent methyltransferase [Sphingomonadales bacterium]NCO98821.1 class I SAM-dependent methyltransferase [Sphingomonadales bacterium]NCP25804.1 class I SAM-dependent methyltransferase [Sphingomonadales bacterium]NCP42859.1 class I SAM-dependent methyltransferase [Sphingomonadales bacterium]
MNSSDFDTQTLDFYNAEAPVYSASAKNGTSRHLNRFLEQLGSNKSILELGCGGGKDSLAMIEAGHNVFPTDGSAEMARKAQEVLGQPVSVLRFDEINFDCDFDGVWAHASLLHVPRSALPMVLTKIWRALKPGGLHFANFKTGIGDGRDRFGRYFNYFSPQEVRDCYGNSETWTEIWSEEYPGKGYDDEPTQWFAIILMKPIS